MQFDVKRAVIGDEMVLRTVRLQALMDSPRAFSSTYEREVARTAEDWRRWLSPAATFILTADGEPRGLVAGVPDQNDASIMHLMAMWIHPDIRGTGAADLLISSVKTFAAQMGATQVCLKVVEANNRARRCYERAGFCATGHQSVLEKNGDVEIEMAWACGPSPNLPTHTSKTP